MIFSRMDETQRPGWSGAIHSLLRVITGALFIQHGVQKLFGLLVNASQTWNGPPPVFSQFWFAGVLEVFGGILIVLGLFTRPVAFLLSGEMAVAYFQAHFPRSPFPTVNNGVPAVLYCFLFLYFAFAGAGAWSIDALIARMATTSLPFGERRTWSFGDRRIAHGAGQRISS